MVKTNFVKLIYLIPRVFLARTFLNFLAYCEFLRWNNEPIHLLTIYIFQDRLSTQGPKIRRKLEEEQGIDASSTIQALQNELDAKAKFQRFPDETTEETIFNDVPFAKLPIVSIRITKNNTRFWVTTYDGKLVFYTSPGKNGFKNKKKSTSVAAQYTANAVGQKLRLLNMRTIRIRIEGFSEGRVASVKGLVQAGSTVVAIQDITTVDWDWSQRAKKRRRVN